MHFMKKFCINCQIIYLVTILQLYQHLFLVQTKTIAVDFVNDDDTSYRLKIAREIEGESYFQNI